MERDLGEELARLLYDWQREDYQYGHAIGADPCRSQDASVVGFDQATDQHSMKIAAYKRAAQLLGVVAGNGR